MKIHKTYSDRIKWAFEQGSKNLGEKYSTADTINKEAQTTLTLIISALAATFGYTFTALKEPINPIVATTLVMSAYYFMLAIYLYIFAFIIEDYPSPYQEPKNLIKNPLVSLNTVMNAEINAMDDRIKESIKWIDKKSKSVNNSRAALIVSPFFFIAFIFLIGYFKMT